MMSHKVNHARVKEVLAKLAEATRQYKILNPPKSIINPSYGNFKIPRKNPRPRKGRTVSRDKPVFLTRLELFLENELREIDSVSCSPNCEHLSCSQRISDDELKAYRSVFDALLRKITTFKPLLSRIKYAYERSLQIRDDRIELMEIVSENLEKFKEDVACQVEEIRQRGLSEINSVVSERNALEVRIEKLEVELEERGKMIQNLKEELSDTHERQILEIAAEKIRDRVDDPVLLKSCLQRARKDLSTAHRRITVLEETFKEVVPKRDLEKLDNAHQALQRERETISAELKSLTKEHHSLKLAFENVKEQKNSLRDRCKMLAHMNTPRPDWSKCGQFIQGGVQRWRDITAKKSSEDRLTILLSELCGAESAENDFFIGQGTDQSVPVFLRYKGKVKNRKLGRREVSILINDIWKNKALSDLGTPMGEYILKYFTERYHLPLMRYEWIYNLYNACQRLMYDGQIGLFWGILWGNIVEDAYHVPRKDFALMKRMMEMRMEDKKIEVEYWMEIRLQDLITMNREVKLNKSVPRKDFTIMKRMMEMRMEDKKINALLAKDIMDILDTMYPYKTNQAIENIVYAAAKQLGIDPSTEAFVIEKLFAPNEEGWERCEFAREFSRQTMQEITEFGKSVLERIDVRDKNVLVGIETLKRGFIEVDEGISQTLLTQHLKWIYKVQDLCKAKPLSAASIIQRMIAGYITQSHPKKTSKRAS